MCRIYIPIVICLALLSVVSTIHAQDKSQRQRVTRIDYKVSGNMPGSYRDSGFITFRYSGRRSIPFDPLTFFSDDFFVGPVYAGYRIDYLQDYIYRYASMPYPELNDHEMMLPYDTCTMYGYRNKATVKLAVKREADRPVMLTIHDSKYADTVSQKRHYTWNRGKISRMYLEDDRFSKSSAREELPYYDERGRLLGDSVIIYSGGKRSLQERQYIYYDSKGRVSEVHTEDIRYNEGRSVHLSYDPWGRFVRLTNNYFDSYDTVAYDAMGRITFFGANLPQSNVYQLHYNDLNQVDTLVWGVFGNSNSSGRKVVTLYYNSFNNPDSAIARTSNDKMVIRYYYELYDEADDTTKPNKSSAPLVIYPNPVANKFTIRWGGKMPAGAVRMKIYSLTGCVAEQIRMAKPDDETTVEVSGLATGIYYISIKSQEGQTIHHQPLFISN